MQLKSWRLPAAKSWRLMLAGTTSSNCRELVYRGIGEDVYIAASLEHGRDRGRSANELGAIALIPDKRHGLAIERHKDFSAEPASLVPDYASAKSPPNFRMASSASTPGRFTLTWALAIRASTADTTSATVNPYTRRSTQTNSHKEARSRHHRCTSQYLIRCIGLCNVVPHKHLGVDGKGHSPAQPWATASFISSRVAILPASRPTKPSMVAVCQAACRVARPFGSKSSSILPSPRLDTEVLQDLLLRRTTFLL